MTILGQIFSRQWISKGGDFVPQKTMGKIWRHFRLSQLKWSAAGASSAQKPGMLLNILQCPRQPHTTTRKNCSCWCGSVGWSTVCTPKDWRYDSPPGHTARLWVQYQSRSNQSMSLSFTMSLSLSFSSFLSLSNQ